MSVLKGHHFIKLNIVTFIVAFCSIIYELVIAQLMSITLGDTFLRYVTTVGFYLFSLGIGAFIFEYRLKGNLESRLGSVEICLSFLGMIAPFICFSCPSNYFFSTIIQYSTLILIGILSGFELPLLMKLYRENGFVPHLSMSIDYFGSFIASLIFPLYLFPSLGILNSCFIVASLNCIVGFVISRNIISRIILISIFSTGIFMIFNESSVRMMISVWYFE